jgi:hypothetical protein
MVTIDKKNKNLLNLFLNNYFNIIMALVVILFLAAAYFIVIKPKYAETMAAITANIEGQQKLYTEQEKKLANLKLISDLYKKIPQADMDKFNGVLPDNYVKERLFGELEEIVTTSGFMLNSVEIEKPEDKAVVVTQADGTISTVAAPAKKIGSINLKLSISSINYTGFKSLLKLLENNLRLFDITKLTFSPGENSAEITLTTYYYNNN